MIFSPGILYVDDEQSNLDTFKRAFGSDYHVQTCLSGESALLILQKEDFPLVIADQRMPGMSGIELCEKLVAIKPETLRIILTAYTETQLLLDAIHRGHVHDFVVKPWKKSELKPLLDRAMEDYKLKALRLEELRSKAVQVDGLREEIQEFYASDAIIGTGSGLKEVMETIRKAAPTDSTLLLLGETGTGKELLARSIHDQSKQKNGPFVPIHCAAFAKTLLESELFGHEKGAFTGAEQRRIGRIEMASGGTLFLDEVGEIPEDIQVKLLRVLQERVIQRVGGNLDIPVGARVIAATHRDLQREVREGRFREDLFYRLNVIALRLPPLRERRQDIDPLARHFFKKYCGRIGVQLELPPATLAYLERYDWPGNVRELENILERAVILSPGPTVDPEDLNLQVDEMLKVEEILPEKLSSVSSVRSQIQQREIQELTQVLTQARGNVAEAARAMGVARTTLFHRLKKYGLV